MKPLYTTLIASLLLAACSTPESQSTVDPAITKQVFDHHFATFKQNDLDGIMADYTEESMVITPDGTFRGLEAIRKNFEGAFAVLPTDGTTMNIIKSVIEDDVAYVIWDATTPTLNFEFGTDTFIIRNGKIQRQTYAGKVSPVEQQTEDAEN